MFLRSDGKFDWGAALVTAVVGGVGLAVGSKIARRGSGDIEEGDASSSLRAELEAAHAQVEETHAELGKARAELTAAQARLSDAERRASSDPGQGALAEARRQTDEARAALTAATSAAEAARAEAERRIEEAVRKAEESAAVEAGRRVTAAEERARQVVLERARQMLDVASDLAVRRASLVREIAEVDSQIRNPAGAETLRRMAVRGRLTAASSTPHYASVLRWRLSEDGERTEPFEDTPVSPRLSEQAVMALRAGRTSGDPAFAEIERLLRLSHDQADWPGILQILRLSDSLEQIGSSITDAEARLTALRAELVELDRRRASLLDGPAPSTTPAPGFFTFLLGSK